MDSPFLGLIQSFSFNFAPSGWLLCAGQILSINQYQALYSLIGTSFGGNGTTNFQLPDLRGCVQLRTPGAPTLDAFMGYYIAISGIYPMRQ